MFVIVTISNRISDDLDELDDVDNDAAFFMQSLHHCLKPWELIARLRRKLKPTGVIAFVGEPVQDGEWRHWGIRLDHEAVYVARARGWFENGWSAGFIRECFARSGMTLMFFGGGMRGEEIGIATADEGQRATVRAMARRLGLVERYPVDRVEARDAQFRTVVGEATTLLGRPAYRQVDQTSGMLVFGPYLTLDAGRYEVSLLARRDGPWRSRRARLTLEVTSDHGERYHFSDRIRRVGATPAIVTRRFSLPHHARAVETRVIVSGEGWTASVPTIRRL